MEKLSLADWTMHVLGSLLLIALALVPAWAWELECCCTRRLAAAVSTEIGPAKRSCCQVKKSAVPEQKPNSQSSGASNEPCRCWTEFADGSQAIVPSTNSLDRTGSSTSVALFTTTVTVSDVFAMQFAVRADQSPPLQGISLQIALCRWLA